MAFTLELSSRLPLFFTIGTFLLGALFFSLSAFAEDNDSALDRLEAVADQLEALNTRTPTASPGATDQLICDVITAVCGGTALQVEADRPSILVLQNLPTEDLMIRVSSGSSSFGAAETDCRKFTGDTKQVVVLVQRSRGFFSTAKNPTEQKGLSEEQEKDKGDQRVTCLTEKEAPWPLAITVSRRDGWVLLDVVGASGQTTLPVPIQMARWSAEVGAFFAAVMLDDENLITVEDPSKPNHVLVVRRDESDEWQTDTGAMFTFYPGKYPQLGLSLGVSSSPQESTSLYVGPTVRLLGRDRGAVASLTAGMAGIEIVKFPGIQSIDDTPSGSPPVSYAMGDRRLDGKKEYEFSFFVAFTLGFRFDAPSADVTGPVVGTRNP